MSMLWTHFTFFLLHFPNGLSILSLFFVLCLFLSIYSKFFPFLVISFAVFIIAFHPFYFRFSLSFSPFNHTEMSFIIFRFFSTTHSWQQIVDSCRLFSVSCTTPTLHCIISDDCSLRKYQPGWSLCSLLFVLVVANWSENKWNSK